MHATILLLLTAPSLVGILPGPANEDLEFYLSPVETQIVERTNVERARYGLAPLQIDMELISSARKHCEWMASYQSLQHTSAGVAENIAMGQATSADALHSWMNSSGHRANILNRSYTRIGVAAYVSPSGRIYWCQQFLK